MRHFYCWKLADGAMRDGISILDQCISTGLSEIRYSDIISIVGITGDEIIFDLLTYIKNSDILKILELVNDLFSYGKRYIHFLSDLITHSEISLS